MKFIHLTNNDGSPLVNAADIWLAFQYYPNDKDARRQAVLVASDERNRYHEAIDGTWKPSKLTEQLTQLLAKKTGQLTVAGYTALAFLLLHERGTDRPTLYAASQLVERAVQALKGIDPLPLKQFRFDGDWQRHSLRAPTGRRDIERAFTEHRSVAHLVAADIASSEHFQLMHIFNRTPETMAFTLVLAKAIEAALGQCAANYFYDFWSVQENSPTGYESLPRIILGGEVRAFLELGLVD